MVPAADQRTRLQNPLLSGCQQEDVQEQRRREPENSLEMSWSACSWHRRGNQRQKGTCPRPHGLSAAELRLSPNFPYALPLHSPNQHPAWAQGVRKGLPTAGEAK